MLEQTDKPGSEKIWTRRAHPNGRAGFQLIELAVVLVIVGIMIAMAAPNFSRGNSWRRIEGAGREMASRMQSARQMAILRRVPYRMTLDRQGQNYSFERQVNDSSWVAESDHAYPIEGVAVVESEIGGSSTADQVVFETRGTIQSEHAPAEIYLRDPQGDEAAVVMVRTGRVTVRMTRGS